MLFRQGGASVTAVIKTFLFWNIWQDGIGRKKEALYETHSEKVLWLEREAIL